MLELIIFLPYINFILQNPYIVIDKTHHAWYISITGNIAHICVFGVGEDLLGKRLEGGDVGVHLGVNHGHLDHHHSHGDQEDAQEPDHHGNVILRTNSLDI